MAKNPTGVRKHIINVLGVVMHKSYRVEDPGEAMEYGNGSPEFPCKWQASLSPELRYSVCQPLYSQPLARTFTCPLRF